MNLHLLVTSTNPGKKGNPCWLLYSRVFISVWTTLPQGDCTTEYRIETESPEQVLTGNDYLSIHDY